LISGGAAEPGRALPVSAQDAPLVLEIQEIIPISLLVARPIGRAAGGFWYCSATKEEFFLYQTTGYCKGRVFELRFLQNKQPFCTEVLYAARASAKNGR